MYSHAHIKTSEGSRWDVLASFQLISLEGVESYDTISGASSKDLHGKKKKKEKSMRYQAQSTSNFWESRRRKAYFTSFNVMKSDEIGLVLVPKCTNCKSLWTKHKQTEQFI